APTRTAGYGPGAAACGLGATADQLFIVDDLALGVLGLMRRTARELRSTPFFLDGCRFHMPLFDKIRRVNPLNSYGVRKWPRKTRSACGTTAPLWPPLGSTPSPSPNAPWARLG